MINIPNTNLYISPLSDLNQRNEDDWVFVHATQTIHYQLFGWDRKHNKPNKNHSNYIIYEKDNHLSLNWVDGKAFLYNWSGPETFVKVLNFIDKWIKSRKVLIHCDQGQSRAPTLGLLYLAKRLRTISNESFTLAKKEFVELYYSRYTPGGIGDYVNHKWKEII